MRIVVKGAWTDGDARRYRVLRADHVELNHAKGFDADSGVSFLGDLPGLRRLTVIVPGTVDLSVLAQCTDLEVLNLDTGLRKPIALGGLPRLRELAVENPGMVEDLCELGRLTRLLVGRYPETTVMPLRKLTELTSLRLYQARNLTTLTGLEDLTRLTELELAGARKLTDVTALTALTGLRKLDITNAAGVSDWSSLGDVPSLTWLSLEDVTAVATVDFVMRLPSLKKFFAIGATKISDGRVAQLGDHPSLRTIALAESRTHDATDGEIRKRLGPRWWR